MLQSSQTRGGYTRQRQGCLTCRRRKKKCDRRYPVCGHCVRLNMICEREEPRRIIPKGHRDAPASRTVSQVSDRHDIHVAQIYSTLDESILHDEGLQGDLLASRRAILRYYTTVFAAMLSTNVENNCFLSVMLPMAFECQTLMKSLVAWASMHLAARDPAFQYMALQYRGSALSAMKSSMEENELSSEMFLAVAMALCSMECISGREGSWYDHLLGGAAALGILGGDKDSSSRSAETSCQVRPPIQLSGIEGRWLLRNFAYHDVLMSITLDSRPLLSGHYWTDDESDESNKADSYFGLASRIIHLTSQISELNANFAASIRQAPIKDHETCSSYAYASRGQNNLFLHCLPQAPLDPPSLVKAREIESELFKWSCPHEFAGTPLQLLADSYRSAALLHLYRTLRRYVPNLSEELHTKISHNVTYICDLVTQMCEGSLAECTLLFPLFMAGGEAEEPSQIEIIREKMVLINKWRHFQNIEHALEVLDELWRLRWAGALGPDGTRLDWLHITKSRNIKLSIS